MSARDLALDVLRRVDTQGAFASAALRAGMGSLESADRGLATELVYGVLRRRSELDKAIAGPGRRLKDLDQRLHDVLRLAAYQILFLDRVPAHAAVHEAVRQSRDRLGERGAKQANAILRRLCEDPQLPKPIALEKDPVAHLALAGNVNRELATCLAEDMGPKRARGFLAESLLEAPLVLRANLLRTTRDALLEEVGGSLGHHPLAVHLPGGGLPSDLEAVRDGRATHQDESSMHVIDLLDPQAGERILDVCAAPGGKTTAIAERMRDEGKIVAHDRMEKKLETVQKARDRLGLKSIETAEVLPDEEFDRVLVDAPCSGLGTLRRHPEIRWRFTREELPRLIATQKKVLRAGAERTRVGGTLVYSVCTVTRDEAENQVRELPGFELLESRRTSPSDAGAPDGFFFAKLVRTS